MKVIDNKLIKNAVIFIVAFSLVVGGIYLFSKMGGNFSKVKTENKSKEQIKSYIAKEIPIGYSKIEMGDIINKELKDMKKDELKEGPWKIVYGDNKKVYFYNFRALLCYHIEDKKFTNILKLKDLNLGHISGEDIKTSISSSNNGNYVTLNNGKDDKSYKDNIYLYDIDKHSLVTLGEGNRYYSKDNWCYDSSYYVYGDINLDKAFVYNAEKNKVSEIDLKFEDKDMIKNIFVNEEGDILVDGSSLNLYKRSNNYSKKQLKYSGTVLKFSKTITLFDNGGVYEADENRDNKIGDIGEEFTIRKFDKDMCVFSDGNITKVFNFNDRKIYNYNVNYDKVDFLSFYKDSKKCFMVDGDSLKLFNTDGSVKNFNTYDLLSYDGYYLWLDENNLIKVEQREASIKLGDFLITKKSLLKDEEVTLYKN